MAQELLSNSLLTDAILSIEHDVISQMRVVKLNDVDSHTRLILALQTTGAVQRAIWHRIQDGHAAVEQINLRGKRID